MPQVTDKSTVPIETASESKTLSTSDCNTATVEILYRNHHDWLLTWLRRKLACQHQAADVMHDTFTRLLALPCLPDLREPRAYLVTTARNLLSSQSKRRQIEQAYLDGLAQAADATNGFSSPEQILSVVQLLEKISQALEGLAEKPRKAFLLRYLEGQSQAAIADQLGVSDRMVRKYLAEAFAHCYHSCA